MSGGASAAIVKEFMATMAAASWYKSYTEFRAQQKKRDTDIGDLYLAYEVLRRRDIERRREGGKVVAIPSDIASASLEELQHVVARQEILLRQKTKQIESQQALLQDLQSQLSSQELQLKEVSARLNSSMSQAGQLLTQLESTQKLLEQREIELVNLRSDLTAIENHSEERVLTTQPRLSEPITSTTALLAERIPRRIHLTRTFDNPPRFISTGSDGKALTSTGSTLHVLSLDTTGIECQDITLSSDISCGSFSKDNEFIIAGTSEGGLQLVRMNDNETTTKSLKGHTGRIKNCWFIDNTVSKGISAAMDRTIKFWDLHRLAPIGSIPVVSQIVNCVGSPDSGVVVSSHVSGEIALWSMNQKIFQFHAHTDACLGVNVSPDGKYLISIGKDDTVKLFDVKMLQSGPVINLTGFTALSTEGAPGMSWDSTVFSACVGGGIRYWETVSGKQLSAVTTDAQLHAWCPRMDAKLVNSDAHVLSVHPDRSIKWYVQ